MSTPPDLTVRPILAVPFGTVSMPDAAEINPALVKVFAARIAADPDASRQNPLCYRSHDDLLAGTEEPVGRMFAGISQGLQSMIRFVNDFTAEQLNALSVQARAWFTVIKPNGRVDAASYPLTAWCAVYCVAASRPSATRGESGLLRLYESRPGTMFADASTASMRLPFTPGHHCWRPVPGEMAIFPASYLHEIAPVRDDGPMVLVTVRARLLAPGQEGVTRW